MKAAVLPAKFLGTASCRSSNTGPRNAHPSTLFLMHEIIKLGAILLTIFARNKNSMENSPCCNSDTGHQIANRLHIPWQHSSRDIWEIFQRSPSRNCCESKTKFPSNLNYNRKSVSETWPFKDSIVNTLRTKQNGCYFVDDISFSFSWLYAESNYISLKFVRKRQTDKYPAFFFR